MENRALIIMAHGSRNAEANREFTELTVSVARHARGFNQVHAAFLELAEPSLEQAAASAVDQGATDILVYPMFFNQGKHVRQDIPGQVEQVRERFPQCSVQLLDYFGTFDGLAATVAGHVHEQIMPGS